MRNKILSGTGAQLVTEVPAIRSTYVQDGFQRAVFADVEARLASTFEISLWSKKFGLVLLTLCAAIVWAVSLKDVNIRHMTDLGLVSVLPPATFIALIILTISFCLSMRQQPFSVGLILLHLVVLIFMLYGITALVEEMPRFAVSWVHVGFTEYISRTGSVAPGLEARFNWPTFFILSAFVTQIAGLQSAISLAAWASVFFNVLYLGPLLMILSSVTSDKRLVWLGIWFFYLTNWIGQDYFAPQALSYLLHLAILGILLKWFKATTTQARPLGQRWRRFGLLSRLINRVYTWLTPIDMPNTPSRPGQRAALVGIIVATFIVIVSSHQLTPFFTLVAVATLVVFNRSSLRGLPILMALLAITWISYMTVAFLAGHISSLTGSIGHVQNTVSANVTNRLTGSPGHLLVLDIRLLMTAFFWGLGFLGGLWRLRNGHRDLTIALLLTTPFVLIGLQDYGGELLLRTYFFILPFVAFFAAGLFYTSPAPVKSWRTTVMIGLVSVALFGGFFFTRYGNERMDYMTFKEVDAVRYLYSIAKPGSVFVVAASNVPLKFQDFEKYYYTPEIDDFVVGDFGALERLMEREKYSDAYLLLTRSQYAYGEMFFGLPPDWGEKLENNLLATGKFEVIFSNDDAKIMILAADKKGIPS